MQERSLINMNKKVLASDLSRSQTGTGDKNGDEVRSNGMVTRIEGQIFRLEYE